MFTLSLSLIDKPDTSFNISFISSELLYLLTVSIFLGLSIGALTWTLSRWLRQPIQRALLSLIAAFFSFVTVDVYLQASGAISILMTGLVLGHMYRKDKSSYKQIDLIWQFLRYIADALLLILMGVTITWSLFSEQWLALLIGAAAALVSRAFVIHSLLPLTASIPGIDRIHYQERNWMLWGHLRGGVTLALALSLPINLDHWWTVQAMAYGAVIFALFIQAPTLRYINTKIG